MPSFFRAGEAESERFRFLCEDYALGEPEGGVGVLREKGIHAVLKRYYQPEAAAREVRVGRFVADAVSPDGSVLEVQTGRLAPLRRKLPALLDRYEVTVVHPLLRVRRVRAVDPQTGELSARRVCGKPETVWNFFYELPPLLPFLQRPNLHFVLPVIETEELRVKGSRRGARVDRLPSALCGEYRFRNAQDFLSLLPAGLPSPFTSGDLAQAASLAPEDARMALYVLHALQLCPRCGRRGRSYLYTIQNGAEAPWEGDLT